MIAYSIAGLRALDACEIDTRATNIRAHLGRDVPDDEEIPLTVWAEVTPDLDDLIWAIERHPARGRILNDFACDCAEHVLPIWLAAYPDDDRPAAAIRVGRDPSATQDQRAAARDAAWAAAGDAARAAARAAAWDAALAAGDAAWDAAWDAALAAGDAARAAERQWQRARLLELVAA